MSASGTSAPSFSTQSASRPAAVAAALTECPDRWNSRARSGVEGTAFVVRGRPVGAASRTTWALVPETP